MNIDLTLLSIDELVQLREAILQEENRRWKLETAKARAEQIATEYEEAVAAEPTQEYVTGMVIGPGRKVRENGEEWINVSKAWLSAPPSVYPIGYRRTGPPVAEVLPFVVGETVKAGDLRRHKGVVYQVVTGHTTAAHWAPDLPDMTALWIPATVTNATPGAGRK